MALSTFGSVFGAVILIAIVQQYFLIAVAIILFFYYVRRRRTNLPQEPGAHIAQYAAKFYRASAREIKRLGAYIAPASLIRADHTRR
jgi:hypothetical protein